MGPFYKIRQPDAGRISQCIRNLENLKSRTKKTEVIALANAYIVLAQGLLQHMQAPSQEGAETIRTLQVKANEAYEATARIMVPEGVDLTADSFPWCIRKSNVGHAFKDLYRMGTWLKWKYGIS